MKKHNDDEYIYDILDDLELDNMEEINNYESDIKADKIKIGVLNAIKSSEHNEQKDSISKKHKTIFQKFKKSTIVAAVFFLAIIGSFTSGDISRANKIENNSIISAYGMNLNEDAVKKYSTPLNKVVSNNGIDVEIKNILIDRKTMWIEYNIHSKSFNLNKEEWPYELDNISEFKINIDGQQVQDDSSTYANVIDKNNLQYIKTFDIAHLNIPKNVKIEFSANKVGLQQGIWKTDFMVDTKDIAEETKEYKVGKIFKLGSSIYKVTSVVVNPIQTTVYYSSFGKSSERLDLKLSDEINKNIQLISASYSGKFFVGSGYVSYSSANVKGDKLIITPERTVSDENGETNKLIKAKEIIINLNK